MTHASCNVVVTPAYEQARAAADRATLAWSSGQPQGKLTGVPVSIKDLVYVAGLPALGGAPANKDLVPSVDAAAVSALKSAGAIVTCKTTTCESGYKLTADSPVSGITRNPWNRDRTSGGSSGGAAASIAAGCGPLAIGTDGVGSIRVPSAVLWRGRYQADLRTGPEIARLFATVMGVAGAYRPNRAHGCRRRPSSGSDCDPRSARCRQSAGAGAALRRDTGEARRDQDRQQCRLRLCGGGA